MRLLFEFALSFLPMEEIEVTTPQNNTYIGKKFDRRDSSGLFGVSILRAGETMENALVEVTGRDIKLGKILIQTNEESGEPELHFLRLPQNSKTYEKVFIMTLRPNFFFMEFCI